MKRKLLLSMLAVLILLLAACTKVEETQSTVRDSDLEEEVVEEKKQETAETENAAIGNEEKKDAEKDPAHSTEMGLTAVNQLTGEPCTEELASKKPYIFSFNYMDGRVAKVQTGIHYADIVVETYIESYVTRCHAVFKNIDGIGQMGPLRSARVIHAQMALSFDANLVHVGWDPNYARPFANQHGMRTINYNYIYTSSTGEPYWFREPNGLDTEHTLYTMDDMVTLAAKDEGLPTETSLREVWTPFVSEGQNSQVEEGQRCEWLSVEFNNGHSTGFQYNSELEKYERYWNDELLTDYKDGETLKRDNIFVLGTRVWLYDDNSHMNISLDGGDGWYASKGKIIPIHWSCDENYRFHFTTESGEALLANIGTSYICIYKQDNTVTWN